ncbi:hypothetical protein JOM56_012614 [Amanita muscaria]
MPNSFNALSAGPDDPKHFWYFDADDDVPMGQPGSSEPTRNKVQQEGRGHRKKADSRFQESIQAEIAETAQEAAEKGLRIKIPSRVPRQHDSAPPAGGTASDEDDKGDTSFVESSGESSEDDEHEAVVDHAELAESLPSKTIPLTRKKKSRRRKKDPKRKRSKSPAKDVVKDATTSKKPRCQSITNKEVDDEDVLATQAVRTS